MTEPGGPPSPDVVEAVFPGAADLATRYVELLATTGVEWGLVGPRETDRLWERHVFNSAALADLVPTDATVVDVGSGAGLPGIPLALRRPDLRVTLLEPLLRRATFLTQAVESLELTDRVEVVRARAEDHRRRTTPSSPAPWPRSPACSAGASPSRSRRLRPRPQGTHGPRGAGRELRRPRVGSAWSPRSSASAPTRVPNPRRWFASTGSDSIFPLER